MNTCRNPEHNILNTEDYFSEHFRNGYTAHNQTNQPRTRRCFRRPLLAGYRCALCIVGDWLWGHPDVVDRSMDVAESSDIASDDRRSHVPVVANERLVVASDATVFVDHFTGSSLANPDHRVLASDLPRHATEQLETGRKPQRKDDSIFWPEQLRFNSRHPAGQRARTGRRDSATTDTGDFRGTTDSGSAEHTHRFATNSKTGSYPTDSASIQ